MRRLAGFVRGRVERGDEGVAMIVSLAFITFFGLVMAGIMSFTDTGFQVNKVVEAQRGDVYAAEGAVEASIAAMRGDKDFGASGRSCPDQTLPPIDGRTVVVKCTPQSGSGVGGSSGGPSTAILTLGGAAAVAAGEPGIQRSSSDVLRVQGNVVSNSTIRGGSNAKINVTGSVHARGDCTPGEMITATVVPVQCNFAGTIPNGADPAYPTLVGEVPAGRNVPNCTKQDSLVVLEPGTYTDAKKLSALTDASGCDKSLIWLKPGAYYFNFTNSGSHEWLVKDAGVHVVGGTPKSWSATGRVPVPFPGGCATSADLPLSDGVQLIFGGDSRLNVQSGTFEVCSPPSGDQVAIYGAKNTQRTETAQLAPSAHTAVPASGVSWVNPTGAYAIGETPASAATLAMAGSLSSGSLTFSGFKNATPPAGATLTGTPTLRVVHMETGSFAQNNPAATVTVGTKVCRNLKPAVRAVLGEDTFDLSSCISSLADLTETITVKYEVAMAGNSTAATATLDGVRIDVQWLTAGFAAQSGCTTLLGYAAPGGDASHCPTVRTDGANSNFAVHGVIYVPNGVVDVNLTNVSSQLFMRGIVARSAFLNVTPATEFSGAVVSVPGGAAARSPRDVELVAYIGTQEMLRSRVKFDDGADGSKPGQKVTVSRWAVAR